MSTRLQSVIRRNGGKYHAIAKELGVNVYWIYQYIKHGTEPKNPSVRKQMKLPIKPRRPHTVERPQVPHHIQWWRRLPKDVRNSVIRQAWLQLNSYTGENHDSTNLTQSDVSGCAPAG